MDAVPTNDLAAIRATYAAVPRVLDARLVALQRTLRPIPIIPAILAVLTGASVLASLQWAFAWGFFTLSTILPVVLFVASSVWYWRTAAARRSELAKDLTDGSLVAAVVVEAHPELYTPGFHDLPARVVYTLDASRRLDVPYLEWLAQGARSLKGTPSPPDGLTEIWQMVNDANAYGARRFPPGLAGNEQSFLAVIAVKTQLLAEHRITASVIPCLFLARRAQLVPF